MIVKKTTEVIPWKLLLSADPEKEKVAAYLNKSEVLLFKQQAVVIGVLVYQRQGEICEVLNLAVDENYQRQKIASQLLETFILLQKAQPEIKMLVVKTGTIPAGPLALYQKCGFVIDSINRDYFVKAYKEPIFEAGVQLKDQVVLKRLNG